MRLGVQPQVDSQWCALPLPCSPCTGGVRGAPERRLEKCSVPGAPEGTLSCKAGESSRSVARVHPMRFSCVYSSTSPFGFQVPFFDFCVPLIPVPGSAPPTTESQAFPCSSKPPNSHLPNNLIWRGKAKAVGWERSPREGPGGGRAAAVSRAFGEANTVHISYVLLKRPEPSCRILLNFSH